MRTGKAGAFFVLGREHEIGGHAFGRASDNAIGK